MSRTGQALSSPSRLLLAWTPLLLLLVTVPRWPDYEKARLALLGALAPLALLALGLGRGRLSWPARGGPALALWACAVLLSWFGPGGPEAWLPAAAGMSTLFLLILAGCSCPEPAERLLEPWAWAGLAAALVGVLQVLGHDPLGATVPHEAGSLLGNRNAATELCAVLAPALAGLALSAAAPRRARWTGLAGALLLALFVGLARGRAGLLGLGAGLSLACLLPRPVLSGRSRRTALGLLLAAGLAAGTGYALGPRPPASPGSGPAGAPAGALLPATWRVRTLLWHGCLEMALDKPLTGFGAGAFEAAFPPYRRPEEIRISSQDHAFETRVSRAHSDPLHVLVETGAAGLVGFLLLVGAALRRGAGLGRRDPALAGLAGAAAGFLVHGLFRAPLLNAPAAAAAFGAMGLLARPREREGKDSGPPAAMALLLLPLLLVPAWNAGRLFLGQTLAARALAAPDRSAFLARLGLAIDASPDDPDLRLLRARELVPLGGRENLAAALVDLERSLALRPHDPLALRTSAEALLLGAPDRPDALEAAAIQSGRAFELDPENPAAAALLARIQEARGDLFGAIRLWKRIGSRFPDALRERARALADSGREEPSCLFLMAWLEEHPGEADEWRDLARRWRRLEGGRFNADLCQARFHRALATRMLQAGNLEEAAPHARQYARLAEAGDRAPLLLEAVLALAQGRPEEAQALAAKAPRPGTPLTDTERWGLDPWIPRLAELPAWAALLQPRE